MRICSLSTFSPEVEWQASVLAILRKLYWLEQNKGEYYAYEVLLLVNTLWLAFCKHVDLPQDQRKKPLYGCMQAFLNYIHTHYADDISLEDLAASSNVSKLECLRCFKQSMQATPFQYLLDFRLEKAADLLEESDEAINAIAACVGFHQSSYFGQCFKERPG